MARILLVRPPFSRLIGNAVYNTYPLGVLLTAAMLKGRGHEVVIFHDDVSNPAPIPSVPPDFRDIDIPSPDLGCIAPLRLVVKDFQPDVVGLGYCTSDRDSARTVAVRLREMGVKRLVAGGVHPSLLPDAELGLFDAVVVGEGDSPAAAEAFETNRVECFTCPPVTDLDLVVADRASVIGHKRYPPFLRGMVQTQRGCPYNCGFCAAPKVFGTKVRRRDPVKVRKEVESLGVTQGRIIDDSFGVHREHGLAVCRELEKVDYRWVCDVALQDIDDERIEHWLRAGCYQINVGIESAVERWQKLSGKHVPEGLPEDVLGRCRGRGLGVVFYFLMGYPGETTDEIEQTLAYVRKLKGLGAKPCISIVTPYPETRLWDLVKHEPGDGYHSFLHQSSRMGFADCTRDEWAKFVVEANNINR